MLHFTPQQIQGGGKFQHRTLMGNWQEDLALEETKMKDYLKKKDAEKLSISLTEQKFSRSLTKAPLSYSSDGLLHFGQKVMLLNKKTNGFLVIDVGDKIQSFDEAYAVTTNSRGIGPMNRSVFVISRADPNDEFSDDLVHYGQRIRIVANKYIFPKPLALRSCPVSPQAYARFSRNQEACMHTKLNYDTVWTIEHLDPNKRYAMKSQVVEANQPLVIEHCGTSHYLASDLIEYRNDFGVEYEVCVNSYATLNKSQSLALEKTGKLTRDLPTKFQQDQNIWTFVTSQDPSTDFDSMEEKPPTLAEIFEAIKRRLSERGAFGVRGLAKVFKNMDKNGNHKLDYEEFYYALQEYGIHLDKKVAEAVFAACDRNKDGSIDYEEFLRFLRGEMNATRKAIVARAYEKLDKNKDGRITLEDIAATYSVEKHPDIVNGSKKPEEVYKEFMKHWDTDVADGIITLEEFTDYYKDMSALIDSDEYFVAMVKSAWKLH